MIYIQAWAGGRSYKLIYKVREILTILPSFWCWWLVGGLPNIWSGERSRDRNITARITPITIYECTLQWVEWVLLPEYAAIHQRRHRDRAGQTDKRFGVSGATPKDVFNVVDNEVEATDGWSEQDPHTCPTTISLMSVVCQPGCGCPVWYNQVRPAPRSTAHPSSPARPRLPAGDTVGQIIILQNSGMMFEYHWKCWSGGCVLNCCFRQFVALIRRAAIWTFYKFIINCCSVINSVPGRLYTGQGRLDTLIEPSTQKTCNKGSARYFSLSQPLPDYFYR